MALHLTIASPGGRSRTITLDGGRTELGRAESCGIRLPFPEISNRHVAFEGTGRTWFAAELGSTNGTTADGSRLKRGEPIPIVDGMRFDIADVRITATLAADIPDGFTLSESGTLLRQLLAEIADLGESAYLTSTDGERVEVPDSATNLVIGPPGSQFRLDRKGDGFWITPVDPIRLDGADIGQGGRRVGHDQVVDSGVRWTFHDPLEPFIEGVATSDEVIAPAAGGSRRWDGMLLSVACAAMLFAALTLLMLFGVV